MPAPPEKDDDVKKDGLLTRWGAYAKASKEIIGLFVILFGAIAAGIAWTTQFLANQPIPVLWGTGSVCLTLGIMFVLLSATVFRTHWKSVVCNAAAGLFFIIASLLIFNAIPPVPGWTIQGVPYEKTIVGDSPLTQVKDEMPPAGFPGTHRFEELLNDIRKAGDVEVQYAIFVSSELTKNRFPAQIHAKGKKDLAIAAYVFSRADGKAPWETARYGFEEVTDSVSFQQPTGKQSRFTIAVVVFPLTPKGAKSLDGDFASLVSVQ